MFASLESVSRITSPCGSTRSTSWRPAKRPSRILISCGARLAPFDIQALRELTAYDELELDTLGDRKNGVVHHHQ
jgi:type IV secretion system protein VirD4